jgi:DNA repair exonuclease SbcCD ATPase subunit
MGWVTLTLRKKELQKTHSDLQMQDLQISRTQRQMARQYDYEQTVVRNDSQDKMSDLRNNYKADTASIYDSIKTKREELNALDPKAANYESEKARIQAEIEAYNEDLRKAEEEYQYENNELKALEESAIQMLEEEANDMEVMYENEKVQIEAQMQAVSAELQAVGEAVSQEIQNSTIKLS